MTRRSYAICQLAGWLGWAAMTLVYLRLSEVPLSPRLVAWTMLDSALGFAISHGFRAIVRARRWPALPLRALVPRVLAAALAQAVLLDAAIVGATWAMNGFDGMPLRLALIVLFLCNFAIAFLAWSFLYFGLHWFERSRRAEQAELRYLKAQLNPHFLFNALNGIRGLVAEDPAKAQHAITQLASLLRTALTSATVDTVTLERELAVVDDYLAIEAIRFDERLAVTRDVAPALSELRVPAMLVQTLVENAIKHGIARRPEGGTLAIAARRDGDALVIEVTNPAATPSGDGAGVGLANARERLQRLFGDGARLVLERGAAQVVARARIPQR